MIDMHSHITINKNNSENAERILAYISEMRRNIISESVVTINPFIEDIKCPASPNHYVKIKEGNVVGEVRCKCTVCQKIVYEGVDPFIKYNNYLISTLNVHKNIHVYPVIPVIPKTTKSLIDYYKMHFSNLAGIKLYTGLSAYHLDEIEQIKCDLPVLVHSGTFPNQDPKNMLKFARYYNGYVQIAHLAALNVEVIRDLKKYENVIIDISPALYMYNHYVLNGNKGGIFNKDRIKSLDDMYELLVDNFGIERIVWGSDVPFSSLKDEIDAFKSSQVFSSHEKEKILTINAKRILNANLR